MKSPDVGHDLDDERAVVVCAACGRAVAWIGLRSGSPAVAFTVQTTTVRDGRHVLVETLISHGWESNEPVRVACRKDGQLRPLTPSEARRALGGATRPGRKPTRLRRDPLG